MGKLDVGRQSPCPELSPPPADFCAPTVTPRDENKKSPLGKNQDNVSRTERCDLRACPDDFPSHVEEKNNPAPAELPSPRLSAIEPRLDFSAAGLGRLLVLFAQGVKCGLIDESEASRLRWVAAAVRAMTQPKVKNPAGIFLKIIKGRLWSHLSDWDFEEANRRLKAHLFPAPRAGAVVLPFAGRAVEGPENPPARPGLSPDATQLQFVRNQLRLRNENLEPAFAVLGPVGFDRGRFVRARQELLASGR